MKHFRSNVYDACPICSGPKWKHAQFCRKCKFSRPAIEQPLDLNIRHIALAGGRVAVVDAVDYEILSPYNWHTVAEGRTFYARRYVYRNGKQSTVIMHRQIIAASAEDHVDHRDGDGLNNRRNNIRIATRSQNMQNMAMPSRNTSGYKGVSFDKRWGGWRASLRCNRKQFYVGKFKSPENAATAWNIEALRLHGEFARLNIARAAELEAGVLPKLKRASWAEESRPGGEKPTHEQSEGSK